MALYYTLSLVSIFFMQMMFAMDESRQEEAARSIFETTSFSSSSSFFSKSLHHFDPLSLKSDSSDSHESSSDELSSIHAYEPKAGASMEARPSPGLTDQEINKASLLKEQHVIKKCFQQWKAQFKKRQLTKWSIIESHDAEEWDVTETSQELSREQTENLSYNRFSNNSFSSTLLQNAYWISDKIKNIALQK